MKSTSDQTFQVNTEADSQEKILVGVVTPKDLEGDSAFGWYAENQRGYNPGPDLVTALKESNADLYVLIFGGTWCEDTQDIVPKFFKAQERAGFPNDKVTFFVLDRFKKLAYTLPEALNITHTPTFLIMKGGREAGRLVEYGKIGNWEKELAGIIAVDNIF